MGWAGMASYMREAGMTWGEREGVTELGEKYLEPVQLKPLAYLLRENRHYIRDEENFHIGKAISNKPHS